MGGEQKPWLSSYPPQVPHHLEYPKIPLYQFLLDAAQHYPDHEALYFFGKRITFSRLLRLSYRFANLLKAVGVRKGDRVALMLPNCPQSVFCYYGALLAGAVVVQTNPLYVEREIEYQMADSGATVMVALDLVYPRVKRAKPATLLKHVFVTSIGDFLPFPKNLLYPLAQRKKGQPLPKVEKEEGVSFLMKRMKTVTDKPLQEPVCPESDLALLQYTGGTTGLPKGTMLTHSNLVANTVQCKHWMYRVKPGRERMLAALPYFHVYGMTAAMNLSILIGASQLLVPRFDPGEVLRLADRERATIFPGAPTMYIALLNHPDLTRYDLSSIECCISGSAPLPVEVQNRFEELTGGRLVEGYGLTETSPVTHANPIYDRRKVGSIGIPWPDTEVKIVDGETGEALPAGEIGELAIRGPQVMKGYWNRPEESSRAFLNGWFLTGDMGYMDEEGFFYIVDRKKDLIIAGGYNIYPREVEEVFYRHPAIQEICVAGVPDPYRGETVKAYVVLKPGARVTAEALEEFARERLAAYKVPRLYEFRQELPKTMVGKILRRKLVEEERKKQVEGDFFH